MTGEKPLVVLGRLTGEKPLLEGKAGPARGLLPFEARRPSNLGRATLEGAGAERGVVIEACMDMGAGVVAAEPDGDDEEAWAPIKFNDARWEFRCCLSLSRIRRVTP